MRQYDAVRESGNGGAVAMGQVAMFIPTSS